MAHSIMVDGVKYNEEKKPLEDVVLVIKENGSSQRVPALNIRFSTPRSMTMYVPPPRKETGKDFMIGAKEEWLERIQLCIEDFEWLLGLSHHRFWSQLVFQKKTWDGLISFLQESYPFYALNFLPDDSEIKSVYYKTASLVFSLIVRITTRVESETEWIGEKKYAALLYEMFIISVPMLLDFCVLFGPSNEKEVRRIINYIFKIQPAYRDDFVKCIEDVKTVYRQTVDKLTGFSNLGEFIKLNGSESVKDNITINELDDILFFLLDVTVSMSTFGDMYTEAAEIMHYQHLEAVIVSVYQKIINEVLCHIKRLYNENVSLISAVECRLNLVRYYLLKLFHQSISTTLQAILEKRDQLTEGAVKTFADGYMGVMNESLSEKEFVKDYNLLYPIESDLEILIQACPEIDINGLLDAVTSCYQGPTKSPRSDFQPSASRRTEAEVSTDQPSTSNKFTGVELESLITEVKDILPHLGPGFIEKCLENYNYSSSDVINAVLENTLPDDLLSLDPELPMIPEELKHYSLPTSKLPDRVNVFDNDEFDVMTRDHIDTTKVHIGKRKDKFKDLKEMIDDKSHREEFRDMFNKLGNVEFLDDVYDDEYDDTYDSVDVAVEEPGEPEKRPFVVPRVLQKNNPRNDEEDNDENIQSDHEEQNGQFRSDKFVEDPAVLRARAEARRLSKQQNKGQPVQHSKDVVGQSKGHGQEKDVLLNRQRKGQHKSSQSNHNRRKLAQNKRHQGMLHV